MSLFHHISGHRGPKRLTRSVALILGMALVGFATVAQADPQVSPQSATGSKAGNAAVSGPSGSSHALTARRRSSFVASTAAYVGMTRTSERQKIQNIDPTSWLARFGDVETAETR